MGVVVVDEGSEVGAEEGVGALNRIFGALVPQFALHAALRLRCKIKVHAIYPTRVSKV